MTDSVVGISPTAADITTAAKTLLDAAHTLVRQLDRFEYQLPGDIADATAAAEYLEETFRFCEYVLVEWNRALPTQKSAIAFYDFPQRVLLRSAKRHTKSAARATFNVAYSFFDITFNLRQLRDYGTVTELD